MKRIATYLARHAQACVGSVGELARAPLASMIVVTIIGITLALPAAMWVAVGNVLRLSSAWDGPGRVSLFLKRDIGDAAARELVERIRQMPDVVKVEFISREQAFEEFKRESGFGDALDALEHNPLPAVVVVFPGPRASQAQALEKFAQDLGRLEGVDLMQLDLEWVQRLHAWLELVERAIRILALLLAIAVLFIVGNTIRLSVVSRRDEIEVSKLMGATDAFIRRPFLYAGLRDGLLGAMLAWVLVQTSYWLLSGPIQELASLYGSRFVADGLDTAASLALLGAGAGLGWIGARLAVGRHLRAIEPK